MLKYQIVKKLKVNPIRRIDKNKVKPIIKKGK